MEDLKGMGAIEQWVRTLTYDQLFEIWVYIQVDDEFDDLEGEME